MTRPEITGRDAGELVPRAVYSIKEFCIAHRISEPMYFKLRNAGLGPREASAGDRIIITLEAARDWLHQCELAAVERRQRRDAKRQQQRVARQIIDQQQEVV
jgi:hypothetical protein